MQCGNPDGSFSAAGLTERFGADPELLMAAPERR
jgi:hypothetical protein